MNDENKLAQAVAVLTEKVDTLAANQDQNNQDTAEIRNSVWDLKGAVDKLVGGHQTMVWFSGFVMSALIVIVTLYQLLR